MPVSAATLARCVNVSAARDSRGWATRPQVAEAIRQHPRAAGMVPVRAHNGFFVFWIAALVVLADDVRLVLRYLAEDDEMPTGVFDTPEGRAFEPAVPRLSVELAGRHIGRRLTLCSPTGGVREITVTGVDEAHVYATDARTGRMFVRRAGTDAVVRGAVHRISHAAGSEEVYDGPPTFDMTGAPIVHTDYFWRAWCSCGQWSWNDAAGAQVRANAARAHLADVGER
jgi:hypothetical protein